MNFKTQFLAVCLLALPVHLFATDALPNILWITCEDMSPDLGCYGDKEARTPNLDKLAAEGARYTHAYSPAPVCSPSRSSLVTGMYSASIGTQNHRSDAVPPAFVKCFPEYLRGAGYYCTNNAKTDYNFPAPVTAWDESSKKAHWKNRPPGAPFFAVFNLDVTHEGKLQMQDGPAEHLLSDVPPSERHDPAKVPLPPYYPDTPGVRRTMALSYNLITEMDHQAGALLKELDDAGLTSNTYVFFFSDHGTGLPRGKRWLYDSGLHVPLLIRAPGKIQPGTVHDELVSFVDFAPTLLHIVGLDIPKHMQGQPFLPSNPHPREYIAATRDRMDEVYDMLRCVRDKQYKYIRNFQPEKPYDQRIIYNDKSPLLQEWRRLHEEGKLNPIQDLYFRPTKPKEELYDCNADPFEVHDLAGDPSKAQVLERLRKRMDDWMAKIDDLGTVPEAELQERMRPGGKWRKTANPQITVSKAGTATSSTAVAISCPTEGASLAYKLDGAPRRRAGWKLYTKPLTLDTGTTLTAIACRLGWKDSDEVQKLVE